LDVPSYPYFRTSGTSDYLYTRISPCAFYLYSLLKKYNIFYFDISPPSKEGSGYFFKSRVLLPGIFKKKAKAKIFLGMRENI